jgi:hypothetical protein
VVDRAEPLPQHDGQAHVELFLDGAYAPLGLT